ncbi:SHOCT domain-containing protein [Hamadaea tsunoensis]|uniref:SHOCT domain-containing protein n=1 Tax=Hamadaea tsunoensis TaxID=53368 RepID=UPI00048639B1|nr:SHOCT domain-containing protein [Hamadaea tsunoensis]
MTLSPKDGLQEVAAVMYGYGYGGWWMLFGPVVGLALLGLLVWVLVRLVQPARPAASPGPDAREILDRRYAAGEIDDQAYAQMSAKLTARHP